MPEAERSDAPGSPPPEQTPAEVREEIHYVDTDVEGEAPEGEEAEQEAAPPEPVDDGTEEIERNGKKYKISRDLKPELMLQEDYTRNIQQVAEQKKAVTAALEQISSNSKERIEKQGQLAHATDMVARYAQLNWPQLEAEDFQLAQTRLREYNQWKDHRDNLNRDIVGLDAKTAEQKKQWESETQQETVRRIREAQASLHRDIPNWNTDGPKVGEFALQNGFTEAELNGATDPRFAKMLYKAWRGEQIASKQKAAAQKAKAPPAQAADTAPLVTVTSRSGGPAAKPTLEKAGMEQYIAIRDAQDKAKAAARH